MFLKKHNMKKIKIAFILSGLGHIKRGAETTFTELMRYLADKDDLEITAFGGGRDFHIEGIRYIKVPCIKRHYFERFPKIKRLHLKYGHDWEGVFFSIFLSPIIIRMNFDILASFSFPFDLLPLKIYRCLKNRDVKTTFTCGGGTAFLYSRFFHTDRVIAESPHYLKLFSDKYPTTLIPGGVNVNTFSPQKVSRKELYLPQNKFIVFSSSALTPIKRIGFLIEAVSKIDNTYLLIAGNGPEEVYLKKRGKELLGKNVKFVGAVDRGILAKYYCLADVFCLPSKIEPFGLVLIEAMACQTPVVTNNTETQKWIVKDGGSCVDVGNMGILVKALERYKDKKLAKETGEKGRKNVQERFSWDATAEKYYQLFKKLVKSEI